jgi:hypothetical protein
MPDNADHSPTDPFDTEMRMVRKAIGPALPIALKYLRIGMPKNREELTQLVDDLSRGKLGR